MDILAGRTPKGDELHIMSTDTGFYRIERRGPGPAMALESDIFTSLPLARKAVASYNMDNAKQFAKQRNIDEIVNKPAEQKAERKTLADSLKNGELDSVLED